MTSVAPVVDEWAQGSLPQHDTKECDFWFVLGRAFSALGRGRGDSSGSRPRLELGRAVGPQRRRKVIPISEIGWPTWIRTMNKGFKDPCVTLTPSAKPRGRRYRLTGFRPTAFYSRPRQPPS